MENFTITPVGFIKSEHKIAENTPIQPVFAAECKGILEVLPQFEDGLVDIEGFSHIILIYLLHKARFTSLLVKPFLQNKEHGIFATRFPDRPNPIGLSIVKLIKRENNLLYIQGVDILDGTPVIDIKPYSSVFDCISDARNGWMDEVDRETMQKRGLRGFN